MANDDRYPEHLMEFAPTLPPEWQQFADLREELLLGYGYHTARAYWGDLQDWFEWAVEHDKDVLALTEGDIRQYIALHRRRDYSESTIRRRVTSLRLLYDVACQRGVMEGNVADGVVVRRR